MREPDKQYDSRSWPPRVHDKPHGREHASRSPRLLRPMAVTFHAYEEAL